MVSQAMEVNSMDSHHKYTLLELIDVAIRDGYEVVNFKILQEIIKTLIKATGLAHVKVPYDEKDEKTEEIRQQVHKVTKEPEEDNIEDEWQHIKVKRRMEAFEIDLEEKSQMIDELANLTLRLRRDFDNEKDFNKVRDARLENLKELIDEMKKEQEGLTSAIEVIQVDLEENVAYKKDLFEAKEEIEDNLDKRIKELKKLILEIESLSAKRDDLMELYARTEHLEDDKVSREELGPLLDLSFLDSIRDLGIELEELKGTVNQVDTRLEELKYEMERENYAMKKSIEEIRSQLDEINSKLAQLDPEDINNAFADLEDAIENVRNDLEDLKIKFENLQREAKNVFNQIAGFSDDLDRLEKLKIDKTECYALLQTKADLSLVMEKLDTREFNSVIDIIRESLDAITEDLKRLTIQVKINEEEMAASFESTRTELSLQMYKEDFILCTEPIRNRIKALMYELKELKKIVRDRLDPDIPGTKKCICINSIAHMPLMKSGGDCRCRSNVVKYSPPDATDKSGKSDTQSAEAKDRFQVYRDVYTRDPPTDLDGIPFPPEDHPRERNLRMIPVLLAKAQPNIGLQHEKRKFVIKQELADYFSKKPTHAIDGAHTLTEPQQRGTSFTIAKVPLPKKKRFLLQGTDKGIYKGSVTAEVELVEPHENGQPKTQEPEEKKKPITKRKSSEKNELLLPPISSSQKPIRSKRISFPFLEDDKETSNKK